MRSGVYDLLHGGAQAQRGHFLLPYVRGNRDGGREQGLMVGMYVSFHIRRGFLSSMDAS